MKHFLGIDTSCYTTSVAILNESGRLIADKRRILSVKAGGKGLSQSEMVFQHTRNLPFLVEEAVADCQFPLELAGVCVSAFPRPIPDSYMPAFLVGEGYARALTTINRIELWRLSHQELHILAGIWSSGGPHTDRFLAVHVSGGTTEIVLVTKADRFDIKLIGGTQDLNAGQFIDRVGVALKLPFPAGPHLESIASEYHQNACPIPVSVKGMLASFSGPASHAQRMIDKGIDSQALAAGVEICIAKTLAKIIIAAILETGVTDVLMVGGVMSNNFIRTSISQTIIHYDAKVRLYFPDKKFSPDNAVGAAYYAMLNGT
ncbi:O-sialoglycoprotein endopeptidase [Dendrosporobacter sp. 1207_IL3150]|uniref:O-sialoglycoprotein endopeptidase n=1 Tax=Dendrosporobacter sp. 1207_IL3150 TaxID=3084054 RepID=UPI002FDB869A